MLYLVGRKTVILEGYAIWRTDGFDRQLKREVVMIRLRYKSIIGALLLVLAMGFHAQSRAQSSADGPRIGPKVEGFEIIADISGSMDREWQEGPCKGMDKNELQIGLIRKFVAEIPQLNYVGTMRIFGLEQAIKLEKDYVKYGPELLEKPALVAAAQKLEPDNGGTPLGPAIKMSDKEISTMGGRKALIIISDFKEGPDYGKPVAEAIALATKHNPNLKIYTIGITNDHNDIAIAKGIAGAAEGGKYYDGCELYSNPDSLKAAIHDIFYNVLEEPDSDGDGVPDSLDQCPNTPAGAIVDYRGCWVIAYDYFFDFDKAVLKKQYLPFIRNAADVIQSNPEMKIEVAGHTDSVGTDEYNLGLGERRASAVKEALVEMGVAPERLNAISFGETRPAATNDTPTGRAINRRVELEVAEPGA